MKIIDENLTIQEAINNINLGLYEFEDIDNIEIIHPNFKVIIVEADISLDIKKYIEINNLTPEEIETTIIDFVAISIVDNKLKTLSISEVIMQFPTEKEFKIIEK